MKRKVIDLVAFITYIVFTGVMFYVLFFSNAPYVRHTSYFIICVNALFALIFFRKRSWLITLGLLFTLASDYFLAFKVFDYTDQCCGMTTFACAQMCYGAYITLMSDKKVRNVSLIIRISLILVAIITPFIVLPVLGSGADYLSILTCIYAVNLLCNIVFSGINFKKMPLLFIGFIFFALCDITVVFPAAQGTYFTIPQDSLFYQLVCPDFNLTWMFYVPSQMLIVLSEIPSILNLFRKEK